MRTLLTRSVTLLAVLTLVAAGATSADAASRRYVALSVGFQFSCALTARGDAYCWGHNNRGELGNGSTSAHVLTPVAVAGGLKFASIGAGESHTCGLTTNGQAYCWGDGPYGALGNGSALEDPDSESSVPVAVAGGLKFASLEVGGQHSCGLTAQGRAYCWGRNQYGQLGDNDAELDDSSVPVAVAGGLKFRDLSLGFGHTSALSTQGKAYGWGENFYGTFGNGNFTNSSVPTLAMGGAKYTSIAGSSPESFSQCYGMSSGKMQCVGYTSDGMFPESVSATPWRNFTPQTMAVRGAVSYTTGDYHICALTDRGTIYCWGDNGNGNLGNGQGPTDSSVPVAVQ